MEKILFWIIFIASLSKAIPIIPSFPDFFYYGSFLGCFIWLVLRDGITVSRKYLFFISAVFFSLWVNDIPALFKASFRMIAFFSIVFLAGPFFLNDRLSRIRRLLFIRTLMVLRWVMLLSFLLKFIAPAMVTGRSGFIGLTSHSMLLSPLAGICILYTIYRFYLAGSIKERYVEIFYGCISFLVLLLSGSRGALGATLVGIIFFYLRLYQHHIGRLVKIALMFLVLVISTSALWWPYTERLRQKVENSEDAGSMTVTRDRLWLDRMDEFKAYPLFGVGFASYNLDYAQSEHAINRESGTVEPGTSWLFLLSSLGLYGFLSFLLPMSYQILVFYKELNIGLNGGLLGSLLVLFSIHMLVEGYVVASGAYLCFFLWLLLSECEQTIQNNKHKRISV